jgi:hypothetical protein
VNIEKEAVQVGVTVFAIPHFPEKIVSRSLSMTSFIMCSIVANAAFESLVFADTKG